MQSDPVVTKWEYRTVWHEIDTRELNKYGADGWELVAAGHPAHGWAYILKRPLPPAPDEASA